MKKIKTPQRGDLMHDWAREITAAVNYLAGIRGELPISVSHMGAAPTIRAAQQGKAFAWATLDEDLTSSGTEATATLMDSDGTIEVKGDRMIEDGFKLVDGNTIFAVKTAGEWQVLASKECPIEV